MLLRRLLGESVTHYEAVCEWKCSDPHMRTPWSVRLLGCHGLVRHQSKRILAFLKRAAKLDSSISERLAGC